MSQDTDSASPPAMKYSRYRSVRQHAEVAKQPPPVLEQKSNSDSGPSRSMSRYRRSRPVFPPNEQSPIPQGLPPVPSIPRMPELTNPPRRVTEPVSSPQKQQRPGGNGYTGRYSQGGQPRETEQGRMQRKASEIREREEQQLQTKKQQEEQRVRAERERVKTEAEQARQLEEENERLLAEQKRKDLERLEAELDAAPAPPRVTSPREKLGFFSRKRAATKVTPPAMPRSASGSVAGSGSGPESRSRSQDIQPRVIEKGGGGIVPGTDAPQSAVNAGERRVLIRCKQSSINLPITPDTTPVDLIYSAANIMTQAIIPSTAILLESYTQLGLERRIRRHEHIRDIMNSWDRDTQNALILHNSDSPNFDKDLEASSVPREAPKTVSVHMYHSQKPGKWSKRFITLMSTGQIYIAKKPGAKPSDKDVASICHLSDFDIYTPTPQQIRKNLKPPKKFCHAIKSQQKTTMFLSTENFVHFFSTDDETLAEQWYAAVQQWRSWYLVYKMGEGKKKQGKTITELKAEVPARPGTRGGATHKVKVSVDENPYTIGSFTPLINLDRFIPSAADPDAEEEEDENRPRQIPFHLRHSVILPSPPPSNRESKRHPPPVSYRLPPDAEDEFASSGLLGRTYSQRQRAQKEREIASQAPKPFVEGPSLLNGPNPPPAQAHQRTLSMKSTKTKRPETAAVPGASNSLQRNPSRREKPKPLLDFTPQFKEAPQWDKTGKGHGVASPGGVPLIEVATSLDNPLGELPTTLLRRETNAVRPHTAAAAGGRNAEGAFVKGGLISGGTGVGVGGASK